MTQAEMVAAAQAEDEALWFEPLTVPEAVLLHALRHLTAAVAGERCPQCGIVEWQMVAE